VKDEIVGYLVITCVKEEKCFRFVGWFVCLLTRLLKRCGLMFMKLFGGVDLGQGKID